MADLRHVARRKARKYGLDPKIFVRQIEAESGFNPTARSPVGALGVAQIMPATARGWGVNPLNPRQALDAAAKNMAAYVKEYGSYENALRAYNAGPGAIEASKGYAETNAYVQKILGGVDPGRLTSAKGDKGPRTRITKGTLPKTEVDIDSALIDSVMAHSKNRAQDIMRRLDSGAYNVTVPGTKPQKVTVPGDEPRKRGDSKYTGEGKFTTFGADPSRLSKDLVTFARKVAAQYGKPLSGNTGATHSKYTINGNVSDHYAGNATDIPLTGAELLAAGRAALIAAGMDPKQARKAPGGLYNVNGHQIIFAASGEAVGGDHTKHLHISV